MVPSLGREFCIPGPASGDGLVREARDLARSAASSQNTQGLKVVAVSAKRPKVPTMGKTTDGRFVGENTGASLYRP